MNPAIVMMQAALLCGFIVFVVIAGYYVATKLHRLVMRRSDPKIGEVWVGKSQYKSPWEKLEYTVTDLKDGWVKYQTKSGYETASSLSDFRSYYRKLS
jgi:hypothetical protein